PEGGQIILAVHKTETDVRLSVQDEGQGIPQEALDHIFDRFYRTDQSRARQTGGAGLGLSIARWVVERHGGWFEVTSREHIGTKMTIVLPQIT
ncbi:MAG: ATP-binding protein, partial [Oscillospiraceae bacterium]